MAAFTARNDRTPKLIFENLEPKIIYVVDKPVSPCQDRTPFNWSLGYVPPHYAPMITFRDFC
jgi:hypothetical protein